MIITSKELKESLIGYSIRFKVLRIERNEVACICELADEKDRVLWISTEQKLTIGDSMAVSNLHFEFGVEVTSGG